MAVGFYLCDFAAAYASTDAPDSVFAGRIFNFNETGMTILRLIYDESDCRRL